MSNADQPPAPSPLRKDVMKETTKDGQEEKIDINSLPEMSADEIDGLIAENDPEFVKTISAIGADKSLTIEQILIDDADAAYHMELDSWQNAKGFKKFLFVVFPFIARISFQVKLLKFRFYAWAVGQIVRLKNFIYFLATDGKKKFIGNLKDHKKNLFAKISSNLGKFKKLSLKGKLVFLSTLVLFGLAVLVTYIAVTGKNIFPTDKQLFVISLSDHATTKYEYNPATEVEPYIDNARAAQNLILIQKMVVNLKPSSQSGPNPMLAAEFFIEGMSPDVVVEIKDREVKIRDLMQRTLEGMTYDELEATDGKREMLSRLQKEVSLVLTTGRVKNVRIKTIVIKP